MPTLYELTSEIAAIQREADENGGELPADAEELLDQLTGGVETKVYGLDCWRRNLLADQEAICAEVARLSSLENAVARKLVWIRDYIRRCMDAAGMTKLGGPTWGASVVKSSPGVDLAPGLVVDELPVAFKRETREVLVDRKAILAAYRAGVELPAGVSVSQGTYLKFK